MVARLMLAVGLVGAVEMAAAGGYGKLDSEIQSAATSKTFSGVEMIDIKLNNLPEVLLIDEDLDESEANKQTRGSMAAVTTVDSREVMGRRRLSWDTSDARTAYDNAEIGDTILLDAGSSYQPTSYHCEKNALCVDKAMTFKCLDTDAKCTFDGKQPSPFIYKNPRRVVRVKTYPTSDVGATTKFVGIFITNGDNGVSNSIANSIIVLSINTTNTFICESKLVLFTSAGCELLLIMI
jgi:hypothetical protein